MKKDEAEKLIQAYMPENKLVMRIDDKVYGIQMPKVVFDGAERIKFRKIKMWRWFGIRVAIGMWVQRIGKRIEEGKRR
jgi:hypothetical protein